MAVRRVLVVEDHPPTRKLLEDALMSIGLGVTCVSNGAEALKVLATSKPDLVFSDFIMPQLNGMELANAIHSSPEWKSIQVAFLTAVNTPDVQRASANVGVRYILEKPLTKESVVALASKMLGGPP